MNRSTRRRAVTSAWCVRRANESRNSAPRPAKRNWRTSNRSMQRCGCRPAEGSWSEMKALAFALCLLAWSLTDAAELKVALSDFTSDDNSYRSAMAAVNFSELLQAKLTGMEGVEWVERSQLQAAEKELNLSIAGFFSSATALRAGKFVKADLLVAGQFTTTTEPGRTLRLELIDLEHADVLAGTSLRISGSTNQPLAISTDDI